MSGKLICKARAILVDGSREKKSLQPESCLLFAVVFPATAPALLSEMRRNNPPGALGPGANSLCSVFSPSTGPLSPEASETYH